MAKKARVEASIFWARKHKWRLTIIGILAVALLLTVVPLYSTRQPAYYNNFNGTKSYYQTWKSSTHEKMDCAECHIEPGFDNLALFKAKSVGEYYLKYVAPKKVNIFDRPTRKACQQCHTTYRVVSASGDLLIPHRAHIEVLKMSCSDCHRALVHTQNTRGVNTPQMKMCLKCHDGRKASAQCKSCHTEKAYPESHRAKDWIKVHSERAEDKSCAKCHAWTPDFCKECHSKKPESHAGNWKKLHAKPAKENSKRCMICHKKKKCLECHD